MTSFNFCLVFAFLVLMTFLSLLGLFFLASASKRTAPYLFQIPAHYETPKKDQTQRLYYRLNEYQRKLFVLIHRLKTVIDIESADGICDYFEFSIDSPLASLSTNLRTTSTEHRTLTKFHTNFKKFCQVPIRCKITALFDQFEMDTLSI
jgi:hypothetical protein